MQYSGLTRENLTSHTTSAAKTLAIMTREVDHFRFQDLPAEMRLMVYRYYFEPSEITFDEVGYTALPPSALTKTSTVISNECKALYLDAVRTFCKADNNIYIDTDDSEYMVRKSKGGTSFETFCANTLRFLGRHRTPPRPLEIQ